MAIFLRIVSNFAVETRLWQTDSLLHKNGGDAVPQGCRNTKWDPAPQYPRQGDTATLPQSF